MCLPLAQVLPSTEGRFRRRMRTIDFLTRIVSTLSFLPSFHLTIIHTICYLPSTPIQTSSQIFVMHFKTILTRPYYCCLQIDLNLMLVHSRVHYSSERGVFFHVKKIWCLHVRVAQGSSIHGVSGSTRSVFSADQGAFIVLHVMCNTALLSRTAFRVVCQ